MERKYADIYHVIESIEKCKEEFDTFKLEIYDNDCVMKGIDKEEADERNIPLYVDNLIATIEWKGMASNELVFHEEHVYRPFVLNTTGRNSIGGEQGKQPKDLGYELKMIQDQLDYAYDSLWDFSELHAESIGYSGSLTDYVFTYEFVI